MQADLTVVNTDLFRATPAEILKTRPLTTIVAGRVAFERDGQ
jgi:predicted amidohydrolase YtcJ